MEKIPTLFERDENFGVIDKVREGCEWVLAGEGVATEKLDGTNIRITMCKGAVVNIEKRRNPTKEEKASGAEPGYVDADAGNSSDKHIFAAAMNTDVSQWSDGEHSCEAVGPKIQGNPLKMDRLMCVPFDLPIPSRLTLVFVPRDYAGLRSLFSRCPPSLFWAADNSLGAMMEGIVFHHPDGRRAKIKARDFR